MTFQDFENYIEDLCEQHVDLLHGTDGRQAFGRLLSDDEFNALSKNAHQYFVTIENVSGTRTGTVEESAYRQTYALQFVGKALLYTGDLTAERDQALQKTWDIMMQFAARMQHDYLQDDCGALQGIIFDKVSYQVLPEMLIENHYGWLLVISQRIDAPAYNAAKWNLP